jgi:AcrR family transcriptional regulator
MAVQATPRLPAAARRELVLRAAMDEFGASGYDRARLDDIASSAGVTKPIIYRHFESKKGLYLAVLARHREDLPTFLADLPADVPFDELMRGILDGWLAYAFENQARWRMLFRDQGGDADVARARADVHAEALHVLAVFLAEHPAFTIPADQVEPTAELVSQGLAAMVLWWSENPRVERATVVEVATRVVTGISSQA